MKALNIEANDPQKTVRGPWVKTTEAMRRVIVDFGSADFVHDNQIPAVRLSAERVRKEEGIRETGSLTVHMPTGGIHLAHIMERDWRGYDVLEFAVWSKAATGDSVQLRFNNENKAGTRMAPYYRTVIRVDFEGWKVFRVFLSDLKGNYQPHPYGVISMTVDVSGWGLSLSSATELCIGNVYLLKYSSEIVSDAPFDAEAACGKAKAQWRELLIGAPKGETKQSEDYLARVRAYSEDCRKNWDKYRAAGDKKFGLAVDFGVAGNEANIAAFYASVYSMAFGYALPGSAFWHDETLLADIREALAYGYENVYGPCVREKGTYGNWWHWDIGIPLNLTPALLLLEDELGPALCRKYLEPFDYLDPLPSMTACNLVWIAECCILSALLQNDAIRVLRSMERLNEVFDYVKQGDGFYEDGSFVQHGTLAYTGGYGLSMLHDLTRLLAALRGTGFYPWQENVMNQYRWVFDTFRPVIYGGNLFAAVRGREVYRNTSEAAANISAVVSMLVMTLYAPDTVRERLTDIVRSCMRASGKNYASFTPLLLVDTAVELAKEAAQTEEAPYLTTKVFGMMDRVAFHGKDYGAFVSMSSTRIQKYEAINFENGTGWYQGDGMLYVYTDGYDYSYSFFHYADPYRMPGTTLSAVRRKNENVSGMFGSSPFCGGVENGEYGIASFILGYGKNNFHESALTAHKSYFFFDDEIVCLGSGIADTGADALCTVIENRLLRAEDTLLLNGVPFDGTEVTGTVTTAHCTGMGGYYFPTPTAVTARKVRGEKDFFEMWTSHGKDGRYAYVLLPGATPEKTAAYARAPEITVLSDTASVHAVREDRIGMTGYVFFAPASFDGITVDAPCALTVREENGQKSITFSDPTHLLKSLKITLTIPGVTSLVSADEKVGAVVRDGTVSVTLMAEGSRGATFRLTVR